MVFLPCLPLTYLSLWVIEVRWYCDNCILYRLPKVALWDRARMSTVIKWLMCDQDIIRTHLLSPSSSWVQRLQFGSESTSSHHERPSPTHLHWKPSQSQMEPLPWEEKMKCTSKQTNRNFCLFLFSSIQWYQATNLVQGTWKYSIQCSWPS